MTITLENLKFKKQTSIVSNIKHFTIEKVGRTYWLFIYPTKDTPAYEYDTYRGTTNTLRSDFSMDLTNTKITIQE